MRLNSRTYRGRRERLGGFYGLKKAFEVAITGLVVASVFQRVDQHASETGFPELQDRTACGGGVLAGAKMLVKRVTYGLRDDALHELHLHELRFHQPHSKVHHGTDRRHVEVRRSSEQPGRRNRREEPLEVVDVEDSRR